MESSSSSAEFPPLWRRAGGFHGGDGAIPAQVGSRLQGLQLRVHMGGGRSSDADLGMVGCDLAVGLVDLIWRPASFSPLAERTAHGGAEGRDRRALPRRDRAPVPAQPGKTPPHPRPEL